MGINAVRTWAGEFQSTLPAWGATSSIQRKPICFAISIHAPRVGSDHGIAAAPESRSGFQSTLPAWGATGWLRNGLPRRPISIHAPRVGSDAAALLLCHLHIISIHAPRVGSDATTLSPWLRPARFQSTLPAWGATTCSWLRRQNTRISIHAPRVGSDAARKPTLVDKYIFQSTLPAWGATQPSGAKSEDCSISIHAPRVGSDEIVDDQRVSAEGFQSTLPAWGATRGHVIARAARTNFNPRSPRGERRWAGNIADTISTNFNPRSPRGERRCKAVLVHSRQPISIHAPRVGSDQNPQRRGWGRVISIHAPRVGSDTNVMPQSPPVQNFNPRSPRGERQSSSAAYGAQKPFQSTLPAWGAT